MSSSAASPRATGAPRPGSRWIVALVLASASVSIARVAPTRRIPRRLRSSVPSPHLRRAGRLHIRLNDIKTRVGQLSNALDHFRQPAILATDEGRLVIANEAACRLFDPSHVLGIDSSGKIVTCSPKATRQLWEALETASRPANKAGAQQAADIIVYGNDQTPLLSLTILPLHRREPATRSSSEDGSIMILGREFEPTAV